DLTGRCVTVARHLDGHTLEIAYDHVVLALGATEHLGRFPGLAEHSFRLKAYAGCLALRNQFIEMLELADMETDPVERARLLTFVVAGGSFAGIEVAGELREFLPDVARRHFRRIDPREIKIVLVCATETVLPEMGSRRPTLSAYVEATLRSDPHVEVRCQTRVASASAEEAILSDGQRIPTRTVISCTGMAMVPVLDGLPLARSPQQRIVTNRCARVPGYEGVWAGGDCAAVPLEDGSTAPALAIWAMTIGTQIGRNIVRQIAGRPLETYQFTGIGDACVFGHHQGVALVKGIAIRGWLAWLAWRVAMLIYLPLPEKKLRTAWTWLIYPFFGRDILNLRVTAPMNVSRVIFDEGQDIVREGDVGNSLFLIEEGEVDVLKNATTGQPERIVTLGPGQQFGEVAVFQRCRRTATVRARSRVKLVQIRREAASMLAAASGSLKATLTTGPGR
ncbi:MAG: FAD-dependent oxidoreductase, partial [Acidobacteria bacterium]|nr:FAD-dependent oxidoreductase [Acidobacteriota bacterium]